MSDSNLTDLRDRKLAEVDDLRVQAHTARGIGLSVRNLAPVIRNELKSLVSMKLTQGVLKEEWDRALEAAEKSDVEDSEKSLAAVSMLLLKMCDDAGRRVTEHGDILIAKHSEMLGKADGISSMLDEMKLTSDGDAVAGGKTAEDEVHA